jgi:hypothetical protein
MRRPETIHAAFRLKSELLVEWINTAWLAQHANQPHVVIWESEYTINERVIGKFAADIELREGVRFLGRIAQECPVIPLTATNNFDGELLIRTGAFLYCFAHVETNKTVEVLVVGMAYSDEGDDFVCLAAVPEEFLIAWSDFTRHCSHLSRAADPSEKVIIIGGRPPNFVPTVQWDDVILPPQLKADLLDDVQSFFSKGIEVYRRLNLKPFRKLLLAGVPGTGKTMLCSALAKWALDKGYLVIYVSSGLRRSNDDHGASFNKISEALTTAADSKCPSLILVEELDAYLHKTEKALVLNVLDGSEAEINEKRTLLVATTNYPEAIDERVLKRPGRLDRIFIIPEIREAHDAEKMLRRYLGDMWRDEHRALLPHLTGYPGAFLREVAIYALTQAAYDGGADLPLSLLEDSFRGLREQIEARDDFLSHRGNGLGYALARANGH